MCQLCERLGYLWTVCDSCHIEFPYQDSEQLAALQAVRMDSVGGFPWYVEGHVPEWLIPSMVWSGAGEPSDCFRCDSSGWARLDD